MSQARVQSSPHARRPTSGRYAFRTLTARARSTAVAHAGAGCRPLHCGGACHAASLGMTQSTPQYAVDPPWDGGLSARLPKFRSRHIDGGTGSQHHCGGAGPSASHCGGRGPWVAMPRRHPGGSPIVTSSSKPPSPKVTSPPLSAGRADGFESRARVSRTARTWPLHNARTAGHDVGASRGEVHRPRPDPMPPPRAYRRRDSGVEGRACRARHRVITLDEGRLRVVHVGRVESGRDTCVRARTRGDRERHAEMRQPHMRSRRRDAFVGKSGVASHSARRPRRIDDRC